MNTDHPPELRQRVLRRVAELDDLDAAAREFGVPADRVFAWLKESAEAGVPLASPSRPSPYRPQEASAGARSAAASPMVLWVHGLCLGSALLWMMVGVLRASPEGREIGRALWIVLGLATFAALMRQNRRGVEARGVELSMAARAGLALVMAGLGGLSGWFLSQALITVAHRLRSHPQEVRTVVAAKVVYHGKNVSRCLRTPPFDDQLDRFDWCTDDRTFGQASVGQGIVLHGTTSWFGFLPGRFELLPAMPADASGAPPARPLPPPTIAMAVPGSRAPQAAVGSWRAPAPSPAPAAPPDQALLAWPGDSLAALRQAYPDAPAPVPYRSVDPTHQQVVWLAQRGIRFFLAADDTIRLVRLDAPFAGAVDGVRLGDRLDDVRSRLGAAGEPMGGMAGGVLFATDARFRLRADLDGGQRVRTLFLIR